MTTATVQLPVLFDVSGTATVFGESATTADFISPHLEFTLDMTTPANGASLDFNDIKNAGKPNFETQKQRKKLLLESRTDHLEKFLRFCLQSLLIHTI